MFHHAHPRRQQAAGADGPGGGAPLVLDEATLGRLRQLDPDGSRGFLVQVLKTYEASLQRHLGTLDEAAASGDVRRAGDVAHTLKSSSGSIGALDFAQCCAAVERLARAGDAAALGAPLALMRSEAARVLLAVRAMLAP